MSATEEGKRSLNKVRLPLEKSVARVPVIMQMEALECGAACLTMVLAYMGKWIPLEKVRSDCGVSRDGSNARDILKAARSYGLEAAGFRFEPEELKEEGSYPCIIHWNFNHFVVLCGFKNDKAIINDPARGNVAVSMDEFDSSFTGICLMFEPTEEFVADGKKKSVLEFAQKRLKGAKTAVIFVLVTSVITSLFGIINPVFARVFMDRLLPGVNPDWERPFLFTLTIFTSVQLITSALSTIYSLRINGKMAVVGSSTYMWKILRLPMEFFSQRMAGDIELRRLQNESVAAQLVNTFAPLVLDAGMMFFYLIVMVRYNLTLSILGVFSIMINLFFSRYISNKRINITRVQMRDSGKFAASTVNAIDMIESIKANGAENGYFQSWSGLQASVNMSDVKYMKLNQILGMLPAIVAGAADILVITGGIFLTMQGHFTLGMVTAFQGFLGSFTAPAMKLISAGQSIQEMRTNMERIQDVMEYPEDDMGEVLTEKNDGKEDYDKLSGAVELRNVTFGYSRLGEPLIKDFSINIKAGGRVAFVGASGCGKSTLSKLISGLYKPWSGEILFDGRPMKDIDRSVFTGSLAVVDQDIILFEDTISNNLKMWDRSIEDFEVIMAARDAMIHDEIMQREGGYEYVISDGGRDFSGGQRQRLEIARILAGDPRIIILDEATSALDAKTEYEVVKAIKERGITCIVIAHRLSTIRDSDEIVVLDHGQVVERGTHEELFAKGGAYSELVASE
ncbi:MAG TPA: NHLP family bacteriocin export ABC transporter peptidase/permease/ATPase subunit [Lachnospiraceae bacterium]|nr:NHLP family bacteriocin export ABC transporter peptidase/permease/ATPase subunit [Lachnospiraceae bacterium]